MRVTNIHKRKIDRSKDQVLELFATLSKKGDRIWPYENWPAMKFENGFKINSEGGHGPIRYKVLDYSPTGHVEFQFQKPNGFNGTHKLEILESGIEKTEIVHTTNMITSGFSTLKWIFVIRWLHDALLEDALDKMENQLTDKELKSEWNIWVKMLRKMMQPKRKRV